MELYKRKKYTVVHIKKEKHIHSLNILDMKEMKTRMEKHDPLKIL